MTPGKELLNRWSFREYLKHSVMILIKLPIWAAQLLLFWIPLRKDRIIIYSLKQRGYSCNLKYLTEYLRSLPGERYEILWIVRGEEERKLLEARGIPAAAVHSKDHFRYRHRAKFVITNDEFYPMFLKRWGQIYVNTWHGAINYKKIGYEGLGFTNPIQKLIYRMNNPCPDIFVSGSRSFTQTTSHSFRFPEPIFLECGLPRNDILLSGVESGKLQALREAIGIPGDKKAVLYAPTFRKGKAGPSVQMDYDRLLGSLQSRFGGEWVVLLRQHYFVEGCGTSHPAVIEVSRYEDMQELILCSDCMISDYSSCMWDYILTGKPCFVYAEDLQTYLDEDRSFFIPIENWPYPVAADVDALCRIVETFDEAAYAAKIRTHLEAFGSFDRGTACRELTEQLKRKEK